jgi:hypothetical protein
MAGGVVEGCKYVTLSPVYFRRLTFTVFVSRQGFVANRGLLETGIVAVAMLFIWDDGKA